MIDLSKDQTDAISTIMDWWVSRKSKLFSIGGFAGTGKTTLISVLRN